MPRNEYSFEKFTKDKQQEYLDLLEQGMTKGAATKLVGVGTTLIFNFRKKNKWFEDKEREVTEIGLEAKIDKVEDALYVKSLEGNVIAQMFFLMNRRPHLWEDKRNSKMRSIDDLIAILPRNIGERVKELLLEEVSEANRSMVFSAADEEEQD